MSPLLSATEVAVEKLVLARFANSTATEAIQKRVVGSDRVSECGQKSRMLSPDHRFVIAMHSPDGVVETGLPVRRPEKVSVRAILQCPERHFLQSGSRA